jgi:hypothetical protein
MILSSDIIDLEGRESAIPHAVEMQYMSPLLQTTTSKSNMIGKRKIPQNKTQSNI